MQNYSFVVDEEGKMELAIIEKKLAMDSRDEAKEKFTLFLTVLTDRNFASDFVKKAKLLA